MENAERSRKHLSASRQAWGFGYFLRAKESRFTLMHNMCYASENNCKVCPLNYLRLPLIGRICPQKRSKFSKFIDAILGTKYMDIVSRLLLEHKLKKGIYIPEIKTSFRKREGFIEYKYD